MSDKRQWIPLGGLLATMAIVIYTVMQIHAQETGARSPATSPMPRSPRCATRTVEIILRGNFAPVEEADDDIERKAVLAPPASILMRRVKPRWSSRRRPRPSRRSSSK